MDNRNHDRYFFYMVFITIFMFFAVILFSILNTVFLCSRIDKLRQEVRQYAAE